MTSLFQNSALKTVLRIFFVAVIYTVLAVPSLYLSLKHTNASPVWPPSGFALAMMLLAGRRIWPGITIGAFAANLYVFIENHTAGPGIAALMAAAMAAGNTLEALAAQALLQFFSAGQLLKRTRNFSFFIGVSLGACTLSSTTGSAALYLGHIIDSIELPIVWRTWWMGDVSGMVVLTPILLALSRKPVFDMSRGKWAIKVMLYVVLVLYLQMLFGGWLVVQEYKPRIYLLFILLIFCGFIMNQWHASLVVLLVSVFAVWSTIKQQGPFFEGSRNESLLALQVFLCVAASLVMLLIATINERKEAEDQLKGINATLGEKIVERTREIGQRTRELEEANKLLLQKTADLEKSNREFQQFAHIASHDLKEPLRTISSYIQLLESRLKESLDSDTRELMDFTVDGARRMQTLINDLLAYANIDSKGRAFEKTETEMVIHIVSRNLGDTISRNGARVVLETEMPVLAADESQLIQLFQNLIDNAVKYRSGAAPEIRIAATRQQSSWLFSVKDNGIGMEKKYLGKIFTIFQRLHTRDKYPGTGIGLAICKKIVERHGGQMWADAEPGKGSAFFFTLADQPQSN